MATKIRRIYKGNNPIKTVEVEGLEPLYVVAVNASKQESIVYAKNDYCTITITYSTTTLTYNTYKGKTLKSIVATLNESAITGAITGKDFLQWFIINNGEESSITPPSLDKTIDCLENVVVNGDMSITGIYDTTQCTVQVYDYDHTTILDTITVNYNTTVSEALEVFDTNDLTTPSINTKEYTFMFNGWTLTKNSNIQDVTLESTKVISTLNVYPTYSTAKKPYTITFYKYKPSSNDYISFGSITVYYNESIENAIARGESDLINAIPEDDLGDSIYLHDSNVLFYAKDTTSFMTQETLLKNIPSNYLKSNINVYIAYQKIVKTYSVKLYDELSDTYIYQNTSIIHGTILENIQELSPIFNQIRNGEYHSTDEQEHYYYNYWLEYSDGTIYDENTLTTVTDNIKLLIKYTEEPKLYTITFIKQLTSIDINDDANITTEVITTTTATYNSSFALPPECFNLLNKSYTEPSTDWQYTIQTTFESSWFSSNDSSRKFTGNTTLKCIGDETFIIGARALYSLRVVPLTITDKGILYPNESNKVVLNTGITNVEELKSYLKDFSDNKSEEYTISNLYYYNIPGKFILSCTTSTGTQTYIVYGPDILIDNYINFPSSLNDITSINVTIEEAATEPVYVTVTWKNNIDDYSITAKSVHKGTKYKDLTYPSVREISGYEFQSWNISPNTDIQILTNTTITAFYTVTSSEPSSPSTAGVYIYTTNKEYVQIASLSKSGNNIYYSWNTGEIEIPSTKLDSYGYITATITIKLVTPNDLGESKMYIGYVDDYGNNYDGYILGLNNGSYSMSMSFSPSNITVDTDTLTLTLTAYSKLNSGEYTLAGLPIDINIRNYGFLNFVLGNSSSQSSNAKDYVKLKLIRKTASNPSSD